MAKLKYQDRYWNRNCQAMEKAIGEELSNIFEVKLKDDLKNIITKIHIAYIVCNPNITSDNSLKKKKSGLGELKNLQKSIQPLRKNLSKLSIDEIKEDTALYDERLMDVLRLGFIYDDAAKSSNRDILNIFERGDEESLIDTEGMRPEYSGKEMFLADKEIGSLLEAVKKLNDALCYGIEKLSEETSHKRGRKRNEELEEGKKAYVSKTYNAYSETDEFNGDILKFYNLCANFFNIISTNERPLTDKAFYQIYQKIKSD